MLDLTGYTQNIMRELVKELEEKHGWEVDNDFLDNNEEFLEALVEIATDKAVKANSVLGDVVGRSEQLPPTCVMDMPDSKYCDCSNECKWCENIRR